MPNGWSTEDAGKLPVGLSVLGRGVGVAVGGTVAVGVGGIGVGVAIVACVNVGVEVGVGEPSLNPITKEMLIVRVMVMGIRIYIGLIFRLGYIFSVER